MAITLEKENETKYMWVKGENPDENPYTSQKEFVKDILEKFGDKIKFIVTTEYDYPNKKVREEELRLFISSEDRVCYFKPRSKRYGYPLMYHGEVLTISYTSKKKKETSKEDKFTKSLNKVIGYLDESGLWEDLNETFKAYKLIGASLCLEAYSEYWNNICSSEDTLETVKARISKKKNILNEIKEIMNNSSASDKALLEKVFKISEAETEKISSIIPNYSIYNYGEQAKAILSEVADEPTFTSFMRAFSDVEYIEECKVKSMTFHKSNKYFNRANITENIKEELRQAIAEKRDYRATGDNGYDVTVNYQSKDNKAWYSEEYRGCGNGHYYLALNHTHALFCEDD